MGSIIRILGYAMNPKSGKVAQTVEEREILGGDRGSKRLGTYWTGRTYKNEREARKHSEELCDTITRESNGHPAAWALDLAQLERC
jgi:hypothetical protein